MLFEGILLSLIAGLAIPAGAFLASVHFFRKKWQQEELKRCIIGFGAGALFSAIAFVLVPDGSEKLPHWVALLSFACGGLFFMGVDILLSRSKSEASNFIAMLLDFVPEAIVLGAVITQSYEQAVFLTAIIAAQNMPEGYAAFTEMNNGKTPKNKLLGMFLLTGLTGPIYILLGAQVFADMDFMLGLMMTFCAGGILYLVFEDIAPRVAIEKHWLPPLGAIGGFMVGMAGYLFIH